VVAAAPSASPRPRGIRVRTEFTTEAEFISAFHDLCEDTMIFAPTEKMKPVGADCAFSLELADGTPMVRGLGVIRNVWATMDSPFARPGIHIEIDQLTNTSEPIYNRLLAAREAAAHKPRTRPAPNTHQLWGKSSGPPTEEMDAAPEPEEPEVEALPQRITREIRGVADLTDDATPDEEGETKDAARRAHARPPTLPGAVAPAPIPRARLASAPMIPVPGTTSPPPFGAADGDLADLLAASRPRAWWMNARVGAVFAGGLVLGLLMSLAFRSSDDDKRVTAAAAPPPQMIVKTEPANCPPPEAPTDEMSVAAAAQATPAEVAIKPVATKSEAAKPIATKAAVATTKVEAPKPAVPKTAPVTKTAATKPSAATKPAATRPSVIASKPLKAAPTRVAPTRTAKAKKPACSSLDCI
jgi:hypothetical protein